MKKIALFIMPQLIFAFCLSIDDSKHPCRYTQGDNWCSTHTIIKQFAYKDNCDGTKELPSYMFGCGTGGCNIVHTKISPVEILNNGRRRAYYSSVKRLGYDVEDSKNSYIYAKCNANGENKISFDDEKEYASVEPELTGDMGDVYKKIANEICSSANIKKKKVLKYFILTAKDDLSLKTLYVKTEKKDIETTALEDGFSLEIATQKDFDNNGELDALITHIAGGNGVLNSFSILLNDGNGHFRESEWFGYMDAEPTVEKWQGVWSVVVHDISSGAGNEELKDVESRYVIKHGKLKKVESSKRELMPTIVERWSNELIAKEYDEYNAKDALYVDLNDDGKKEHIEFTYWGRWGSMFWTVILPNGSEEKHNTGCKRIGVLKSKHKDMHDIVCDEENVYRWDGSKYINDYKSQKESNPTFSPKEVAKLLSKAKETSKEYLKESAEVLDEIIADTKSYGKDRVAIISSYYIKSSSNPYQYKLLSLYRKEGSDLVPILSNFKLSYTQGESRQCDYYRAKHQYKIKKNSTASKLEFEYIYRFEHEKSCKESITKKWSVKLEPKKFILKNGKFVSVKEKEKPIFDLDEVLKSTKKGLRYKEIVLEAMLFEEPISKENVGVYAQIAQALKKTKHLKEAEFLLRSLFNSSFKSSLALEELANIYYENFLRLQKRADILFKEGKINPSSIATQANAEAIKALMLYRLDEKLQKEKGIVFMGKVIDERFEEVEHFVMDNDDVIEFIKTGIYADVTVYDYLDKELQEDIRLIEARDITLKDEIK